MQVCVVGVESEGTLSTPLVTARFAPTAPQQVSYNVCWARAPFATPRFGSSSTRQPTPHKPLRSQSPTHKLSSVQWAVQDGVCFSVRTSQTVPFELGVVLYGLQDVSVLSENPMYEAFISSSSRVRAHRQTTSPPTASSAPLFYVMS